MAFQLLLEASRDIEPNTVKAVNAIIPDIAEIRDTSYFP